MTNFSSIKMFVPYHAQSDPCPPIGKKYYSTPPHLYIGFQSVNLPQFSPLEALKKGTLWPVFYDYYEDPYRGRRE